MANVIVDAEVRRERGKNASRRLRHAGRIPAVLYGRGLEPVSLTVDPKAVSHVLHSETGRNTIFSLQYDGNPRNVLIREFQLDPVKGSVMHADFQAIAMDEVMTFQVPVQALGTAVGVKNGGILDVVMKEIEVECLPADVPDHVRVDVSGLDVGDSVRVESLQVDTSKITVLSEPGQVVVTVVAPHVTAEEEEAPELEAEAEPEVIKRGKAEEEAEG